jgi:DNA invertase Pin-like site-specific DNA recombinase
LWCTRWLVQAFHYFDYASLESLKISGRKLSHLSEVRKPVKTGSLEHAGCAIVLEETGTGTKRLGRDKLDLALKLITEGDVLTVTPLDRLGRSLRDLANIAHELAEKGAALRVIEQNVDTSTSAGRAFFGMLATFAQFETDVRRERQAEGIAPRE